MVCSSTIMSRIGFIPLNNPLEFLSSVVDALSFLLEDESISFHVVN